MNCKSKHRLVTIYSAQKNGEIYKRRYIRCYSGGSTCVYFNDYDPIRLFQVAHSSASLFGHLGATQDADKTVYCVACGSNGREHTDGLKVKVVLSCNCLFKGG